jgi:hypothetical protein
MEDTMLPRCTIWVNSLIKAGFLLGPIALSAPLIAPALAASGPFQALYIFPGVTDSGGPTADGVATAVHCFSFSPSEEDIQYVVRNAQGTLEATLTTVINQFQTLTIATHATNIYAADLMITHAISEGVFGISATSTNIVCTAQVIDASATVPNGIDLHGARFNPISGSQE